jgi:glycosyltransferase involved in cell wall biosynthesis
MRILICHNFYQQGGGEDQVFASEAELLRNAGHDVQTYTVHNDSVELQGRLKLAVSTLWNRSAAHEIADRVRKHRAQVVHFHNTFPLLSPSVYSAARGAGAAVVQTLHNYRLICPAATLFREGKPCEKCLGKFPLPGIVHSCYRGSRAASAVTATMLGINRANGAYADQVDAYIALTQFARNKFLEAGFNPGKIRVKPNFLESDPGAGTGEGKFALFAGRLSEEKGIRTLVEAWKIAGKTIPLKICGDGPDANIVRNATLKNDSIQWLGRVRPEKAIGLMGRAAMLVFPSLWYEGFPRTIVESLARGTPVIASDLGSMKELIEPGRTGALFAAGDSARMANTVVGLCEDSSALAAMRRQARETYLEKYNAGENHRILLGIYHHAIECREEIEKSETVAAPF